MKDMKDVVCVVEKSLLLFSKAKQESKPRRKTERKVQ